MPLWISSFAIFSIARRHLISIYLFYTFITFFYDHSLSLTLSLFLLWSLHPSLFLSKQVLPTADLCLFISCFSYVNEVREIPFLLISAKVKQSSS